MLRVRVLKKSIDFEHANTYSVIAGAFIYYAATIPREYLSVTHCATVNVKLTLTIEGW